MKFVLAICLVVAILADASAKKKWKKKYHYLERKLEEMQNTVNGLQQKVAECCHTTDHAGYCGPTCLSSTCRVCSKKEVLKLDLDTGTKSGSLMDVEVENIDSPVDPAIPCSYRALLKASFQPASAHDCRNLLKIQMAFGQNRTSFMLNFGDSASNNGYGGDGSTQSRDSEIEAYGSGTVNVRNSDHCEPKGGVNASHAGALGHSTDNATFWLAHNYYRLKTRQLDEEMCNVCLYDLNNGEDREGLVNRDLYLAFNRVVSGTFGRDGTGACSVRLSWVCNIPSDD